MLTQETINRLRIADAEIEELKQSLRYVEIQLAKAQEEKEALGERIKKQADEHEVTQQNLIQQMNINKQNQEQIQNLQKKITGFSTNQSEVSWHRHLTFWVL